MPHPAPRDAVPQGAAAFIVYRVTIRKGRNAEGKKWSAPHAERLKGDADAKGRVADAWPVEQYDPAAILQRWGEGRYRVDFVDGKGAKVGASLDFTLAAPAPGAPAAAAPPLRPRKRPAVALEGAEGDDGEPRAPRVLSKMAGGSEAFEILAFMEQLRSDAREQERQAAERDALRTQQFFQQQMTMMQTMFANSNARPADSAASAELLRRELAVQQREQFLELEKKFAGMLEGLGGGGDGDDDDGELPPAKNAKQAAERVGIAMIEELGQAGPDVINGAVAMFGQFMRKRGLAVSPRMRRSIQELERAQQAAQAAAGEEDDDQEDDDDGEGATQ